MAKRRARRPDNVCCPGCRKDFTFVCNLKRHLGIRRFGQYKNGKLVSEKCATNRNCIWHLTKQVRRIKHTRVVVYGKSTGNFASLQPSAVSRSIPANLQNVPALEQAGIGKTDIEQSIRGIQGLPCIKKYMQAETAAEKKNLLRFLVFALYSLHAMLRFEANGLTIGCSTLAIGIGEGGMNMLGDAKCFKRLYDSLTLAFDSIEDCILWVLVSHCLARESVIEALRNIVCARSLKPTRANVSMVAGALARIHGIAPSRMRKGKRSWRQADAFGTASLHPLSAGYCGSQVLFKQLRNFRALRAVATNLTEYRNRKVYFSDIVRAIGNPKLIGYARKGYWTVHLARMLDPAFAGVTLYAGVEYGAACAEIIFEMGSGARAMALMGIRKDTASHQMLRLCECIESLASWYGFTTRMTPNHLACAVCEAHRRGVFSAGAMRRRPGL